MCNDDFRIFGHQFFYSGQKDLIKMGHPLPFLFKHDRPITVPRHAPAFGMTPGNILWHLSRTGKFLGEFQGTEGL